MSIWDKKIRIPGKLVAWVFLFILPATCITWAYVRETPSEEVDRKRKEFSEMTYFVKVERVVDGDTIVVDFKDCDVLIMCNDISVRLLGIDAPELSSKNETERRIGKYAFQWLAKKIQSYKNEVMLQKCKPDKYFRIDCEVYAGMDGNLNLKILEEKEEGYPLAVPYNGEGKKWAEQVKLK